MKLGSLIKSKLEAINITYACHKCKSLLARLDNETIEWAEENLNYIINTMYLNAQSKDMVQNDRSRIGKLVRSRLMPAMVTKLTIKHLITSCINEIKNKSDEI